MKDPYIQAEDTDIQRLLHLYRRHAMKAPAAPAAHAALAAGQAEGSHAQIVAQLAELGGAQPGREAGRDR